MKKLGLTLAIALHVGGLSAVHALSLELVNRSNWDIHELYFSPADQKSWGPDQLEDEIIKHGETFKLTKISKGNYDVKFVDEDGDSCEVEDVDFTSSERFVLTENALLGCQEATAEASEDDSDEG